METLQLSVPQTQSALEAQSQTILHQIYQHILAQPVGNDFSLLRGEMGFALFERYYQRHFGLPIAQRTWERIDASLQAVGEVELIHTFAGGITGMAWGLLHLCHSGLLSDLEADAQDMVEGLDEALFIASMDCFQEKNFDYLNGGLGVILYFLERHSSPQIDSYITALVKQLEQLAVPSAYGGITWASEDPVPNASVNFSTYDLGLAHGTASIVAILSLLYEKGYARQLCGKLIQQALEWMWSVRNQSGKSIFPSVVRDRREDQQSRLAWCYGDLGIASAIYLAGEKLSCPAWKKIAMYTIRKSASRWEFADTKVRSVGICHGSAGVSHIYRRFAKVSGHPLLYSAAQFWLADTLRRASSQLVTNELLQMGQQASVPQNPDLGLVEGEASVGMMLLTALGAPIEWDRFLLLS
jgi:lantibiotic modifying enzyme